MTETLSEWRRLHPATPLVRSVRYLVAMAVFAIPDSPFAGRFIPQVSLLPGLLFLVINAGLFWLAWRYTRYRVAGPDFLLDSGVVIRRSRRVPLARLEAIDVVRPLVARILNLAELRMEVAGGGESDAKLAYLTEGDAQRLRGELLALAAEVRQGDSATPRAVEANIDTAPEHVIARTDTGTLLAATLLGGPVPRLIGSAAVPLTMAAVGARLEVVLTFLLPMAIGTVTQTWGAFTRDYGTTVALAGDGLRVRRGLLETRAQTVPRHRVQGVALREPMLWRLLGWMKVEVTIAGYGSNTNDEKQPRTLLPVGNRAVAAGVVASVVPQANAAVASMTSVPSRARWRAPIESSRLAIGLSDEGVVASRRGRFGQRRDIVPVVRAQSVRLTQGPLQRLFRLVTIDVDLAAGPVKCRGLHRDENDGRVEVDAIAAAMRAARSYGSAMASANDLADRVRAASAQFHDAIDALEPADFDRATEENWSAKAMLGHFAFWTEAIEAVVVGMLRGGEPPAHFRFGSGYEPDTAEPWPRDHVHNAREAAWARDRPLGEVIDRLAAAEQRAFAVVDSLTPAEQDDERFRSYVLGVVGHYVEHEAHLRQLAARRV